MGPPGGCAQTAAPTGGIFQCGSESVALDAATASRAVRLPGWAAVPPGVRPLIVLHAGAPENTYGVDVVLAVEEACAAYAEVSNLRCNLQESWTDEGVAYYYVSPLLPPPSTNPFHESVYY